MTRLSRDFGMFLLGAFLSFLILLVEWIEVLPKFVRDLFQTYGDVAGAILGTFGAFGAAWFAFDWQRKHQRIEQEGAEHDLRRSIALMVMYEVDVLIHELSLQMHAEGRIPIKHELFHQEALSSVRLNAKLFSPQIIHSVLQVDTCLKRILRQSKGDFIVVQSALAGPKRNEQLQRDIVGAVNYGATVFEFMAPYVDSSSPCTLSALWADDPHANVQVLAREVAAFQRRQIMTTFEPDEQEV